MSASTRPFQPKGEVAEWELLLPVFRDAPVGELISYERMAEALGRDPRENRSPIYRMTRELEAHHARTVNIVRGEGYRITPEPEVRALVVKRVTRSRRQVVRGRRTGSSVDTSRLSADDREKLARTMERLGRLEQAHRAMRERQDQLERRADRAEQSDEKLSARLDEVTAALRKRGLLDT